MKKGYWIFSVDVQDAERYKDYIAAARPVMEKYEAKFLVRAGECQQVEGQTNARNTIVEFESYEKALEAYHSAEYQAAKQVRQEASTANVIVVEGA